MATITSFATGNWNDTTTWIGGVVPGSSDTAIIESGHTVTVNAAGIVMNAMNITDNGIVDMDYDLGCSGSGILMEGGGYLTHNGTVSSPRKIYASTATKPGVQINVGTGGRLQDRYLRFQDFKWSLGNNYVHVDFNTGSGAAPIITNVTPLYREQVIANHFCEGREYGRVYRRGGQAGVITLQGKIPWSSFSYDRIQQMAEAGYTLSLITEYVQHDSCYIESFKCSPKGGELKTPFTMTLIEVR